MATNLNKVLCEIDEIIAKISNYDLTYNERNTLVRLFKAKLEHAKLLNNKLKLELCG